MAERLLMDPDRARLLVLHLGWVADALDLQRRLLIAPLQQAGELLSIWPPPIETRLKRLAHENRLDADDLDNRLRSVVFGGATVNAGLWALAALAVELTEIETRGGRFSADGDASRADLEWAAENLTGDPAIAAAWLLAHPQFLAAVATSESDDDYLDNPFRPDFVDGEPGPLARLAPLTLGSIAAFEARLDAWATLLPFLTEADTAAKGGDPDGVVSRSDFEAFLERIDLPDDVRIAINQVLDDGAYHDSRGLELSTGVDALSFVPLLGDGIDATLTMYYLSQGDIENAVAHGVGLVPIPGLSSGAIKGAREVVSTGARLVRDEGTAAVISYGAKQTARNVATHRVGVAAVDSAEEVTDNPYVLTAVGTAAQVGAGKGLDAVQRRVGTTTEPE